MPFFVIINTYFCQNLSKNLTNEFYASQFCFFKNAKITYER